LQKCPAVSIIVGHSSKGTVCRNLTQSKAIAFLNSIKMYTLENTYLNNHENVSSNMRYKSKIDKWRLALAERTEENLLLKDNLADILKNNYDKNLLEEIEDLQTRLICEDELIASLKSLINDLEEQIIADMASDGKLSHSAHSKMVWIQREIACSDVRFCELKEAFSSFRLKVVVKQNRDSR